MLLSYEKEIFLRNFNEFIFLKIGNKYFCKKFLIEFEAGE